MLLGFIDGLDDGKKKGVLEGGTSSSGALCYILFTLGFYNLTIIC